MKKYLKALIILFVLIFTIMGIVFPIVSSLAHSGRTDGSGGHYDRDTGEYHYHHGYPAHQHNNGECPYDISNKPDPNNSKDDKGSATFWDVIKAMLTSLLPAIGIGAAASYILSYIFLLIWGDDKGCSITMVSFVVLSVVSYIWLIWNKLK